jgi:two-component sensor histidine kinase
VNEFVTNAFKHGFGPEGSESRVHVRGLQREGRIVLEVTDNGSGVPEDFDMARIKGLGMRLVRFVSSSLGGDAGARNGTEGGAVFFVAIPVPEDKAD